MKAVIMAGGEGSRLRPLTCALPKPMVPILNRPCMEHIVNLLRRHEIRDIATTLQYLPEEIRSYFGDGGDFGVNLVYFTEDTPLGTAGSVKNASSFLDETFIVISGDALTDCHLQRAAEFHREKGALATLVLTPVSCPLEYGVVITDREGRIVRFLEKPGWGEVFSDTVNTGIYILEPEILDYIEENKMVDFSKDIYPRLLAEGKALYAFVTEDYWCDIGNVEQYLQAQFDILEKRSLFSLPGMEIRPGVRVGRNVRIDPSADVVPPVVIGDDCSVGPGAKLGPLVVLGNGVRIGRGASLKRSVIWDYACIGEGAELRGAIIGKGGRILSGAMLFEGVVAGDRTLVGERSVIKPGVKIWPGKWVEKGTRLSSSLVWGNCGRARLFGSRGITGDLFAEITPDFACRIGMAVGSDVNPSGRFALGGDGHPDTLMIKNAVLSGLMSTGLQVVDLGKVTFPVQRYGVRAFDFSGSIHICRRGRGKATIRFLNELGADYSRDEQRKVEGLLGREEYRFASPEAILPVEYLPDVGRSYLNYLLGFLDRETTGRGHIRIVLDYDPDQLGSLVPELFDALGCEVITFATPRNHARSLAEMLKTAEQFGDVVRDQGADFGAVLDAGGEEVIIVDEKGRIIGEEMIYALLSLIVLNANGRTILALPVNAPESVVEMAKHRGADVKRTKTAPWALMQAFLDEDVRVSQRRCPQFLLYGDALAILASLAEFLAREGKPLSEILRKMPCFATARRDVEVTWDAKGKVLRRLVEEAGERRLNTAEGIKVQHPEGWALILPDADEPLCRVYGEAFNQEVAESLTEMYVQKIQGLCESGQPPGPSTEGQHS